MTEKQPWEMTKDEFVDFDKIDWGKTGRLKAANGALIIKYPKYGDIISKGDWSKKYAAYDLHEKLISKALSEGKTPYEGWEKDYPYLIRTIQDNLAAIAENIGNYIQFGGHGIYDGLKDKPTKAECYMIIGFNADGDLIIHGFNKRSNSRLPSFNFRQTYRIVSRKQFKTLTIYQRLETIIISEIRVISS